MSENKKTDEAHFQDRIRNLNRIIRSWQKHANRMGKILGCIDIQDELEATAGRLTRELERAREEVDRLKAENESLRADAAGYADVYREVVKEDR